MPLADRLKYNKSTGNIFHIISDQYNKIYILLNVPELHNKLLFIFSHLTRGIKKQELFRKETHALSIYIYDTGKPLGQTKICMLRVSLPTLFFCSQKMPTLTFL